jgi:hypothetical protein
MRCSSRPLIVTSPIPLVSLLMGGTRTFLSGANKSTVRKLHYRNSRQSCRKPNFTCTWQPPSTRPSRDSREHCQRDSHFLVAQKANCRLSRSVKYCKQHGAAPGHQFHSGRRWDVDHDPLLLVVIVFVLSLSARRGNRIHALPWLIALCSSAVRPS